MGAADDAKALDDAESTLSEFPFSFPMSSRTALCELTKCYLGPADGNIRVTVNTPNQTRLR